MAKKKEDAVAPKVEAADKTPKKFKLRFREDHAEHKKGSVVTCGPQAAKSLLDAGVVEEV